MARSLLDVLIEKGEFSKRGNPTTEYSGLDDNSIPVAVDESLSGNDFSPTSPGPARPYTSDDRDAASVFTAIQRAARRDPGLQELLSRITTLDEFLLEKLTSSPLGTSYVIGYQNNRYSPPGFGNQFPTDPQSADNQKLQFVGDGEVKLEQMKDQGEHYLANQVLNPPGGETSRFIDGVLRGNNSEAHNDVEAFYGKGELERPFIGREVPSAIRPTLEALKNTNIANAMNQPEEGSFLFQTLKKNRFRPVIQGNEFTLAQALGELEYTTDPIIRPPDNNADLPYEIGELGSNQFGNTFNLSPRSPDGINPGGLALLGDAKVKQMQARQPNSIAKGSPHAIDTVRNTVDLLSQLSDGNDVLTLITAKKLKSVEGSLPLVESDVTEARYALLVQKDLSNLTEAERAKKLKYFELLEQKNGQYFDKDFPGLREISLVHLMYEMSRVSSNMSGQTYPYSEDVAKANEDRDVNTSLGDLLGGLGRQVGGSLLRTAQNELGRLAGTNRQVARALQAPAGSALRETLRSPVVGPGYQPQTSSDAKQLRLEDFDRKMRELFNSNGTNEPLRTLKERYKEGYEIFANPDRSYKEYEKMFIGLAEDVQTVKHFLVRKGVERFYLVLNGVQPSPFNQYKGRGMEGFGIENSVFQRQRISNSANALGDFFGADAEQAANFVAQTAAPIAEAIQRSRGQTVQQAQPELILGKSPIPNLLGTSRSLEFMHSPLVGRRANSLFQSYVRTDEQNELNMLTVLTQQLGKSSNMATSKVPGSTFINDLQLDQAYESIRNTAGGSVDTNNGQGNGELNKKGINALKGFAKNVQDGITSIQSGQFNQKIRSKMEQLADNPQQFNMPEQIDFVNSGERTRISPNTVKEIETALESTYCPFYFQDLRTNEIISFHAFLKSASTSFKPAWKKNNYIGRVDPVATYGGNTERSVSIEFSVFATNPADFAVLYDKMNRLIGLLYPQYDSGIKIDSLGTQSFMNGTSGTPVIPFSQRQIAGPLIRLRVGDIIKSAAYDDNLENVPSINARAERYLGILDIMQNTSGASAIAQNVSDATTAIGNLNASIQASLLENNITSVNNVATQDLSFVDENNVITLPPHFSESGATKTIIVDGQTLSYENTSKRAAFEEYIATINRIIEEERSAVNTQIQNFNQSVEAFLEEVEPIRSVNRGNAVIRRSFAEVGGRGLAGFIEGGIDLNLLSEYPWETTPGLRAPMGFDVSFTFVVLHDVPPGINEKGEMRPVFWPKIQPQAISRVDESMFNDVAPSFSGMSQITGDATLIPASQPAPDPSRPRSGGSSSPSMSGAIVYNYRIAGLSREGSTEGLTEENDFLLEEITVMSAYTGSGEDPLYDARDLVVEGIDGAFRVTNRGSEIRTGARVSDNPVSDTVIGEVGGTGGVFDPNTFGNESVFTRLYTAVPVREVGMGTISNDIRNRRVRRA